MRGRFVAVATMGRARRVSCFSTLSMVVVVVEDEGVALIASGIVDVMQQAWAVVNPRGTWSDWRRMCPHQNTSETRRIWRSRGLSTRYHTVSYYIPAAQP
jgi:hypothetical protein